jgi:hypothetical protein
MPENTGIVFGTAKFIEPATISLFARSDKSLVPTLHLDSCRGAGEFFGRMKLEELKELRNACNHAIKWLEEKERDHV